MKARDLDVTRVRQGPFVKQISETGVGLGASWPRQGRESRSLRTNKSWRWM